MSHLDFGPFTCKLAVNGLWNLPRFSIVTGNRIEYKYILPNSLYITDSGESDVSYEIPITSGYNQALMARQIEVNQEAQIGQFINVGCFHVQKPQTWEQTIHGEIINGNVNVRNIQINKMFHCGK